MSSKPLDDVDRGILHLLQKDARNLTPVDMAEELPVSAGTVRNRIERMEERGILRGYVPTLDYGAAGFPLTIVFTCTAPVDRQVELAERALQTHRVVNVRELLSSQGNVEVVAVATDLSDITSTASELIDLGFEIEMQRLLRHEHVRPFNHFGEEVVEDE